MGTRRCRRAPHHLVVGLFDAELAKARSTNRALLRLVDRFFARRFIVSAAAIRSPPRHRRRVPAPARRGRSRAGARPSSRRPRRRNLIAPRRPAIARTARKQFEVGAGIEPLDAAVNLIGLLAVLADGSNDDLMHVLG